MRKEGSLENIEKTKEKENQSDARKMHTYGQKKKAAKRAVDKARIYMEADLCSKCRA